MFCGEKALLYEASFVKKKSENSFSYDWCIVPLTSWVSTSQQGGHFYSQTEFKIQNPNPTLWVKTTQARLAHSGPTNRPRLGYF